MNDLDAKLEQAEKDKRIYIKACDTEIADLKKQIDDAKKPVLRHGDYGIDDEGDPCFYVDVHVRDGGGLKFCGDCGLQTLSHESNRTCQVRGNIIDDLEVLQENVTEFEITETSLSYKSFVEVYNGLIYFRHSDGDEFEKRNESFSIEPQQLKAFILKLRQLEDTLKRNQAKENNNE